MNQRRLKGILDTLPLFFVAAVLVSGVGLFFAPYNLKAPAGPIRLGIYLTYAVGAWSMTGFYFVLLVNQLRRKTSEGKAPVWAVVVFYVELFFSVALTGVFIIILTRYAHPDVDSEQAELILRSSYSLIGASATSTLLASVVGWVGYKKNLLGRKIRPFPFGISVGARRGR